MSAELELVGLLASLSPETRERLAAVALAVLRAQLRDELRWPRSQPPVVADVPCYVLSDSEEGGP